jgi:hypothetical protein
MSLISDIVSAINNHYSTDVFADEKYEVKRIVGLAYPYPEKKGKDTLIKIVPAQYDNNGEGSLLDINDDYSLMIYHRIASTSYQNVQDPKIKAVGDARFLQATSDLTMTVWAKRPAIQMQADDLSDMLVNNLPQGIEGLNGVARCRISPAQTDFDFIGIFRREYQSVDYFLKPEHILLQVRYRAVSIVNVNCIT